MTWRGVVWRHAVRRGVASRHRVLLFPTNLGIGGERGCLGVHGVQGGGWVPGGGAGGGLAGPVGPGPVVVAQVGARARRCAEVGARAPVVFQGGGCGARGGGVFRGVALCDVT